MSTSSLPVINDPIMFRWLSDFAAMFTLRCKYIRIDNRMRVRVYKNSFTGITKSDLFTLILHL